MIAHRNPLAADVLMFIGWALIATEGAVSGGLLIAGLRDSLRRWTRRLSGRDAR